MLFLWGVTIVFGDSLQMEKETFRLVDPPSLPRLVPPEEHFTALLLEAGSLSRTVSQVSTQESHAWLLPAWRSTLLMQNN